MDGNNKTMSAEAIEERRKYYRAWAKNHPENIKRNHAKYWERRVLRAAQAAEDQAVTADR